MSSEGRLRVDTFARHLPGWPLARAMSPGELETLEATLTQTLPVGSRLLRWAVVGEDPAGGLRCEGAYTIPEVSR